MIHLLILHIQQQEKRVVKITISTSKNNLRKTNDFYIG